jgi:hypothetical protein
VEAASEVRPESQPDTRCLNRKEDVMKTKTGLKAGFGSFVDPNG